jgi:hypothetical protein
LRVTSIRPLVRITVMIVAAAAVAAMIYAGWSARQPPPGTKRVTVTTKEACAPRDIEITTWQAAIADDCPGGACTYIKISGEAVNRCTHSTGVKMRVTAKDAKGEIVETAVRALGNVRNIPPGASRFEISDPFPHQSRMATFELEVAETRQWK